jgi:copper chaperone CopZ
MDSKTLSIPNISCGHCVKTIERELGGIHGVTKVSGDAGSKEILVAWEAPATLEKIKAALKEINYPAEES